MNNGVEFFVPSIPAPKGSWTPVRPRGRSTIAFKPTNKRTKPFAQAVAAIAAGHVHGDAWGPGIPVRIRLIFFLPRPACHFGTGRNAGTVRESAPGIPIVKPDLDKLIRNVLDALTGIVYVDDAQVAELIASKEYVGSAKAKGAPAGVFVSVSRAG